MLLVHYLQLICLHRSKYYCQCLTIVHDGAFVPYTRALTIRRFIIRACNMPTLSKRTNARGIVRNRTIYMFLESRAFGSAYNFRSYIMTHHWTGLSILTPAYTIYIIQNVFPLLGIYPAIKEHFSNTTQITETKRLQ